MNNRRNGRAVASTTGGIGLLDLILIVNIVLKLANVGAVATWSWALVLWPLWLQLGLMVFVIVFMIWWIKK